MKFMTSFVCVILFFIAHLSNAQPSPGYYPSSQVAPVSFSQGFRNLWGPQHQSVQQGTLTIWLDRSSGSGFKSLRRYRSGYFSTAIKLQPGYTAGVITSFYLSNNEDFPGHHDEVDIEFLGKTLNEPYTLQTNVYIRGSGDGKIIGREMKFHLWFDPTQDFHNYAMLWSPSEIVFFVDDVPIRRYPRKSDATYPSRPMWVYGSIWDASSWATDDGKYKANYNYQPFVGRYRNFKLAARKRFAVEFCSKHRNFCFISLRKLLCLSVLPKMAISCTSTYTKKSPKIITRLIRASNNSSNQTRVKLLLALLILCWSSLPLPCDAFGTFGFKIHHRFSDPVKQILDFSGEKLPEKGTAGYYAALSHRDLVFHGRRLSSSSDQQPLLSFSSGNSTYRLSLFGFLHYANVTVGTPGLSFLVALDTGSDLFWLPCDCESCVKGVRFRSQEIDFNIYSLSTSSTGSRVSCNSSLCEHRSSCVASPTTCPYRVMYLSANTSSSGYLVEDVLPLVADGKPSQPVNPKVPFGCGKVQTGSFLEGGAPNGLLGLGLDGISVPSILASQKVAANSFSMCFGDDGTGRITFGDRGSSDQGETPFNLRRMNPHYNISVTQITVGSKVSDVGGFYAIFDSGTSFTYLNDPAYSLLTENFNSQVKDSRHTSDPEIPFEYCYDLSSSSSDMNAPRINLTMQGGDQFYVIEPTLLVSTQSGDVYCLGIVKSDNVNIIGQNFMTGYRVVFDREKMVLGWKQSNCNDAVDSNTLPITPQSNTAVPPISSIQPQDTSGNTSHISGASSTLRTAIWHLSAWTWTLILVFLQVLLIL